LAPDRSTAFPLGTEPTTTGGLGGIAASQWKLEFLGQIQDAFEEAVHPLLRNVFADG
jgi:hypothetical protein